MKIKTPKIRYIRLPSIRSELIGFEWQDYVKEALWWPGRLLTVVDHIKKVMQEEEGRIKGIVFVDRKSIVYGLEYLLNKYGQPAKAITGDLNLKKREQVLQSIPKKGVLVATYQSVGVGFNLPELNTAFYYMYVKFRGTVKQAIGRILRGAPDPLLIDFVDPDIYSQRRERFLAYQEEFGISKKDIRPYEKFLPLPEEFMIPMVNDDTPFAKLYWERIEQATLKFKEQYTDKDIF